MPMSQGKKVHFTTKRLCLKLCVLCFHNYNGYCIFTSANSAITGYQAFHSSYIPGNECSYRFLLELIEHPKKKFLQDLETIRSMTLQDLVCKITTNFETISGEIMPE